MKIFIKEEKKKRRRNKLIFKSLQIIDIGMGRFHFLAAAVLSVFILINLGGTAQAVSIGVAPGILNLGDVYPGTSKLVEFFLITTFNEDVLVRMTPIEPHLEFFKKRMYSNRLTFIPEESSNEDVKSWIKFPENPVLVSPRDLVVYTFPGGETVRANKKVRAILTIPKDADPGYHIGAIHFSPSIATGRGGSVATMAVTRFMYVFYVKPLEGQEGPRREGKITDIEAYRADDGRVRIDVLFQNTGTDTMFVRIKNMKIYDNFGEMKTTAQSGYVRIRPKETKVIPVFWNNEDAKGSHRVVADVDFLTGSVTADTEVIIPEISKIPSPSFLTPSGKKGSYPWWIVFVVGALFAVVIYFKSDWLWLMVALALILAFFIVMGLLISPPNIDIGAIPWWLIVIFIALIALIVYWKI